jgi:hypothetical protein
MGANVGSTTQQINRQMGANVGSTTQQINRLIITDHRLQITKFVF